MALSIPRPSRRGGLQVPLGLRTSASCRILPPCTPHEAGQGCGSTLLLAAGCGRAGRLESGGGDCINVTFIAAFAAAGLGSRA